MTARSNPRQAGVDRRYRERGGLRFTMRISAEAENALTLIAQQQRISRREVIERLLAGEALAVDPFSAWVQRERLSVAEAAHAREWG